MTITIVGDTVSKVISWVVNDNNGGVISQGTGTSMANAGQLAAIALKGFAGTQAGIYTTLSTNPGIA